MFSSFPFQFCYGHTMSQQNSMQKTGTDICQRCGNQPETNHLFSFRQESLKNLSAEVSAFLTKTHFDRLCLECLAHYENLFKEAAKYPFPQEKHQVVEGVHYYREKGCWVFTELYSLQRGHCCKNGCRHCAYGYKNARS